MKRSVIISNKHGIHELPHELPNDLTLTILGNQETSGKFKKFIKLQPSAQSSSKNENFVDKKKKSEKQKSNFSRCALFYMKTMVCLKYFNNDYRLEI